MLSEHTSEIFNKDWPYFFIGSVLDYADICIGVQYLFWNTVYKVFIKSNKMKWEHALMLIGFTKPVRVQW